jgi:hypothetical protein
MSEMVDNVADDDVEPKPAKIEASDIGSGDVKQTVNVKPFKVKIPFQANIGKIEEKPKPVPIGVVCKVCDTASFFLQQMKDGESEKSYLVGFVDKQQRPNLLFV